MSVILKTVLSVIVAIIVFVAGYFWKDVAYQRPIDVTKFQQLIDPRAKKPRTPTQIFKTEFDRVVVESSVPSNTERLKYAAMNGLFESLGDPHTNFFEPVEADQFNLTTRGDFVGIGARLSGDPSGARVAVVFKGSPAEKSGVKPGDTIVEVNGKSTAGIDTDAIVSQIRGKEGTLVTIKVIRTGVSQPITLKIKRALVVIPTAEGRMLEGEDIGVVTISGFAQQTPIQMDQAMTELLAKNPQGLIFDLRGNPGGLLDSAVDMLGRFFEGKLVVSTRRRDGKEEQSFAPYGKVKNINCPVVVLINEDSASAAEIFSGVLQDYKKATLVGEHSYGKSSVQNVKNLVDLASAKITIAKYFLPSGRDIGRKLDEDGEYVSGGLKPDVLAPFDFKNDTVIGDPAKDSQLRKAIEVIKSKRG